MKKVKKGFFLRAAVLMVWAACLGEERAAYGGDWLEHLWEETKPLMEREWGFLGPNYPVYYPNVQVYPMSPIEGAWGMKAKGRAEVVAFLGDEYILILNGRVLERGIYQLYGDFIVLGNQEGRFVINGALLQLRLPTWGGVYQRMKWFWY
ncbi:MAG: hypothetical protein LBS00_13070 [Synergistaceae bacterium]|nr:hypothetical protein [Synergistaceae bacterium]